MVNFKIRPGPLIWAGRILKECELLNFLQAIPSAVTAILGFIFVGASTGLRISEDTDINIMLVLAFLGGVIVVTRQATRLVDRLNSLETSVTDLRLEVEKLKTILNECS